MLWQSKRLKQERETEKRVLKQREVGEIERQTYRWRADESCNTIGLSTYALILPVTVLFATLYNFIDRLERGGEQHCIIFMDTVYQSV